MWGNIVARFMLLEKKLFPEQGEEIRLLDELAKADNKVGAILFEDDPLKPVIGQKARYDPFPKARFRVVSFENIVGVEVDLLSRLEGCSARLVLGMPLGQPLASWILLEKIEFQYAGIDIRREKILDNQMRGWILL